MLNNRDVYSCSAAHLHARYIPEAHAATQERHVELLVLAKAQTEFHFATCEHVFWFLGFGVFLQIDAQVFHNEPTDGRRGSRSLITTWGSR